MSEKTREQIDELKAAWLKDPNWDIENTGGYGAHYDELLAFHQQHRKHEWRDEKFQVADQNHEVVIWVTNTLNRPKDSIYLSLLGKGGEVGIGIFLTLDEAEQLAEMLRLSVRGLRQTEPVPTVEAEITALLVEDGIEVGEPNTQGNGVKALWHAREREAVKRHIESIGGMGLDEWYESGTPGTWQAERFGKTDQLRTYLEAAGFVVLSTSQDYLGDDLYALARFRLPDAEWNYANGPIPADVSAQMAALDPDAYYAEQLRQHNEQLDQHENEADIQAFLDQHGLEFGGICPNCGHTDAGCTCDHIE